MKKAAPVSSTSGHFHAVRFYNDDDSLCRIVAEFLAEGLDTAQPAIVIATPSHRAGIVRELRARHFDVEELQRTGALLSFDAAELLSTFMVNGKPDAAQFTSSIGEIFERACRGRTPCTVRAYGQMVDLLWRDGLHEGAIQLEVH